MDPSKSSHSSGAASERRLAPQTPHPPTRQEKEQPHLPNRVTGTSTPPPNRNAQPSPHKQLARPATNDHPNNTRPPHASRPESDPKKVIETLTGIIHARDVEIHELRASLIARDAEIRELEATFRDLQDRVAPLDAQCQFFQSEAYRQEVLSIRVHLQVNDLLEPWEVSQKFGEITRQIEDVSRNLGEILSSSKPIRELKTVDFINALLHRPHDSQAQAPDMPLFVVEPEDFIDFGCRALINETLVEAFLGSHVFRPGLKSEENRLYNDTYSRIRKQEPQIIAGRWRISTFKSRPGVSLGEKEYKELALDFCETTLGPLCGRAYDRDACVGALKSIAPAIAALFERAIKWNTLAKSSVVMLDFHPMVFPAESQYDPSRTALEGRRPKLPASKTILLTSKLGLLSSRAVGEQKDPEYSIQSKAAVLAAEYFG